MAFAKGWIGTNAVSGNQSGVEYVPYQTCPKCNGQGVVSKPPYVAEGVNTWVGTASAHQCDVCNGAKIILMCRIEQKS